MRSPILLIAGRGAPRESGQLYGTTKQLAVLGWPHQAKLHDGAQAIANADLDAASPSRARASGRAAPTPAPSDLDASTRSGNVDAASVASVPWPDADTCNLLPV